MKKKTITITSFAVIAVMLLTACSAATQLLPQQASNLLDTVKSAAAQASTPVAPNTAPAQPVPGSSSVDLGLLASYQNTLESIYTNVNPSVVNIHVVMGGSSTSNDQGGQTTPNFPFNFPGQGGNGGQNQGPQVGEALGSGFVWDTQGHIVTNNHVVDGATKVDVTFSDQTVLPATVVGTDPDSDLAVIKVDAPANLLHPVQIADSSQVKVGQMAVAIGNPFGLNGTMTVGIVSALGRSLPANENFTSGPTYTIPDVIQTDAPINPGNSGGVLLNDQGQVIGVTAAIESASQANAGIGFVIPASIVAKVVPTLIQSGNVQHPYLGISGTTLTPDLAKAMNLSDNQHGALVAEVVSGGPADKAGLHASTQQTTINGQTINVGGDVITAVDGQPIKQMDDLIAYLSEKTTVGQTVTLTILRNGQQMDVKVTLGARPASSAQTPQLQLPQQLPNTQNPNQQQPQQPQQQQPGQTGSTYLGIAGLPMDANVANAMNLPANTQGILVEQVQPGSPAETAGLKASQTQVTINGQQVLVGGDIIQAVDGQTITDVNTLRNTIQQKQPGDTITLSILRNGSQLDVTATLAAR